MKPVHVSKRLIDAARQHDEHHNVADCPVGDIMREGAELETVAVSLTFPKALLHSLKGFSEDQGESLGETIEELFLDVFLRVKDIEEDIPVNERLIVAIVARYVAEKAEAEAGMSGGDLKS